MSDDAKLTRDGRPLRILCANDDGINAPGFAVLEEIAHSLSDDVWCVAPEYEQSGAGHALTLHDPVRLREIAPRRYAVRGTPTDCVLMACHHILDAKPDLVLSGVNKGQNMAEDVTYSGTIAAAMEGTLLGVRSIALSQAYAISDETPDGAFTFAAAARHGADVVRRLWRAPWAEGVLMNVNFPYAGGGEVKGVRVTRQGQRDQSNFQLVERVDGRGHAYFWFGFKRVRQSPAPDSDLAAVYAGHISVTPLHLDLTHDESRAALSGQFA